MLVDGLLTPTAFHAFRMSSMMTHPAGLTPLGRGEAVR